MEIKKINGEIIFKADVDKIKDAVEDAVMRGADLRYADLGYADLCGANLGGANLRGADLRYADLVGADLCGANLGGANLGGANLRGADLVGANLSGTDLYNANLRDADLGVANLGGANIIFADLGGANISGANLRYADLCGAKNIPYIPLACPSDGDFTGWKMVNGLLVELRIPEDAKRSSATTEKCRCDKALVVSITDIDSCEEYAETINYDYAKTTYRVGEMVYPDSFDTNRWIECSNGIHFFTNKESAMNY